MDGAHRLLQREGWSSNNGTYARHRDFLSPVTHPGRIPFALIVVAASGDFRKFMNVLVAAASLAFALEPAASVNEILLQFGAETGRRVRFPGPRIRW